MSAGPATEYGPCILDDHRAPSPGQTRCSCWHQIQELKLVVAAQAALLTRLLEQRGSPEIYVNEK